MVEEDEENPLDPELENFFGNLDTRGANVIDIEEEDTEFIAIVRGCQNEMHKELAQRADDQNVDKMLDAVLELGDTEKIPGNPHREKAGPTQAIFWKWNKLRGAKFRKNTHGTH